MKLPCSLQITALLLLALSAKIAAEEIQLPGIPHPAGPDHYAKRVVVKTTKDNDQVNVQCTLPQIQSGKILYKVKSVSVKGATKKQIATTDNSRVKFSAPEAELSKVTLDVTYIDARSFSEKTQDVDQRVDWNMRFIQFKMSDILERGYRKNQ